MPKSKLVVVWGKESLLGTSIIMFLAAQPGWDVVSISTQKDLKARILANTTGCSDIVIIQQEEPGNSNLVSLQLLQSHPFLKLIKVSLENNVMDVYSKQQISVNEASDLITAIEMGVGR